MDNETIDDDELSLNIEDSDKEKGPGLIAGIKEKLSLKLVIIISSVILLIAGGIIFFILFTGGEEGMEEADISDETITEETAKEPQLIHFNDVVKLASIEIKLSDLGGEKVFEIGIQCRIDQQELRSEIEGKEADVADVVKAIMKTKTYAELQDADGKILLRNEIIKHLNEIMETGRIMNIFFYKFLIL